VQSLEFDEITQSIIVSREPSFVPSDRQSTPERKISTTNQQVAASSRGSVGQKSSGSSKSGGSRTPRNVAAVQDGNLVQPDECFDAIVPADQQLPGQLQEVLKNHFVKFWIVFLFLN